MAAKIYLVCDGTSVRQMPQNYLIAGWHAELRHWVMYPDLAADMRLVLGVARVLMQHEVKWNPNGGLIVAAARMPEPIGYYTPPAGPNGLALKIPFYEKRIHPDWGFQVLIDYLRDGDFFWVNIREEWIGGEYV